MAKSLLEVLRDVSLDPNEQAAFSADPSGYLAQYGYEDVHPDDISEAFSLVADTLPPEQAQTVAESQAAGNFGGGIGADEGLAGNGVPAPDFGAGYEPVDAPGGADPGLNDLDDLGPDTAFGEGVGNDDLDDLDEIGDFTSAADDSGLDDSGFGHGEDVAELDDGGAGVGAGYAETHGYDDGGYETSGDADYGSDDGGYDSGSFDDDGDTGADVDDIGSF